MMCPDCVPFARVLKAWNVSRKFVHDLIRAGQLRTHEHGVRTTLTKESVQDCQWRIAVAKADMEEAS